MITVRIMMIATIMVMPVTGEIALLLFIVFILLLEFMICGDDGWLLEKKRNKSPLIGD
ncbi:MAG: hypothetical protein C5S41_00420 [Candidatus Methanomarinus sp.]|nr:MAG: hypothetical protein C5S41_00420 [ANME-2 cluster archaeon]